MDLTEADYIKKWWQEYTEELYKKDLNYPGNHDGVITHLEPDILECKVKWALESTTMNNAQKQRKAIEWERLVISSRILEIPRNISKMGKDGHNKQQKQYAPNRGRRY